MDTAKRRIAINTGGAYVPGLNAVIAGAVLAAHELGWEVLGIRDGFEGLLFRDRYPDGGLVKLTPDSVDGLGDAGGTILGTSQIDPFRVRSLKTYEGDMEGIEEVDRSDDLLGALRAEQIERVVSVVGQRTLALAWKLARKGLKTVCVPKSVENDVASTSLSFGFNSALSFTVEALDRIRTAARTTRRLAVVEVLGTHTGWLALQAGMAASADAVLIPELPFDLDKVTQRLKRHEASGRPPALVVVAEGARAASVEQTGSERAEAMERRRRMLSPGSVAEGTSSGRRVIERSGAAGEAVALELQRRCDRETFSFTLGQLIRGGRPTVTDRQLGLAYGAAAVRGLHGGQTGAVVAFHPPQLEYVPLATAVNKTRRMPVDSHFVLAARALGIALGD